MKKLALFIIIFSNILFAGCSKDKNQHLNITLSVSDAITGEPIEARVRVISDMAVGGINGMPNYETNELTDEIGWYQANINIGPEPDYTILYRLQISRPEFNVQFNYSLDHPQVGVTRSLAVDKENHFDIKLEPFYSYRLSAKNVNCTGPTDSLWITDGNHPHQAYGCADTTFVLPPGFFSNGYYAGSNSSITFTITTKRQGQINTSTETHNLTMGDTPDEIVIEY